MDGAHIILMHKLLTTSETMSGTSCIKAPLWVWKTRGSTLNLRLNVRVSWLFVQPYPLCSKHQSIPCCLDSCWGAVLFTIRLCDITTSCQWNTFLLFSYWGAYHFHLWQHCQSVIVVRNLHCSNVVKSPGEDTSVCKLSTFVSVVMMSSCRLWCGELVSLM